MYENLKGKRLLIVGSPLEEKLVEAAHDMGLYVIVCDNVEDRSIGRAKNIADEAWDIDYNNLEIMTKKCLERKVDGVFAGYGEYRVLAASRLSKELNLHFYATEEQIEITRNKETFRKQCQKYKIPVPFNYASQINGISLNDEMIRFPVIVKPTDRSGRIGISICNNKNELNKAIELALSKSDSKTYVVEEYLVGTEFTAVYTAADGIISLSCIDAKYITKDQKVSNFLCDCALAPAPFIASYIEQIDEKVKLFLTDLGLHDGIANFQGMYTENGIYLFEMGLRLNGNNDWLYIEKENGLNHAKMLMAYSLSGSMMDDINKDTPFFKKYYCTLPIYAHAGTISKIDYSEVLKNNWASISTINAQVGNTIVEDGTSRQKLFAILIEANNLQELKERIIITQGLIHSYDSEGNDMLFMPFDVSQLS